MKQLNLTLILLLLAVITLPAQKLVQKTTAEDTHEEIPTSKDGVQFFKGSWEEVKAESQRTGKPIFVDAYAVWCGPCKYMSKNVFTNARVGAFFNANFINYKFDMEKGEGPGFRKAYGISGYPTLLFLNGEGEVKHRVLGARDVEGFMAEGKKALGKFKVASKGVDNKLSTEEQHYKPATKAKKEEEKVAVKHIKFFKGNWDEVLEESQRTGKPIFVDAFATWCGPCKYMEKYVFSDEKVAKFYNANFINYKFDMEKGEGRTFSKNYAIKGYPTLLYLDHNGTVKHRVLGGRDTTGFITEGKKALEQFNAKR